MNLQEFFLTKPPSYLRTTWETAQRQPEVTFLRADTGETFTSDDVILVAKELLNPRTKDERVQGWQLSQF